jgi:hypothetical protein
MYRASSQLCGPANKKTVTIEKPSGAQPANKQEATIVALAATANARDDRAAMLAGACVFVSAVGISAVAMMPINELESTH